MTATRRRAARAGLAMPAPGVVAACGTWREATRRDGMPLVVAPALAAWRAHRRHAR